MKVLFEMMIKCEFRANGYKCGDCFGNQPASFLLVSDGVWVDMSSELDSGLGILGIRKWLWRDIYGVFYGFCFSPRDLRFSPRSLLQVEVEVVVLWKLWGIQEFKIKGKQNHMRCWGEQ